MRRSYDVTPHSVTEICAFWGMTVASLLYIFRGLLNFLLSVITKISAATANLLRQIASICDLLGSIALIVAVAIPAYGYVKYKSKGWRVFYWIMLAVYILGVIFGMLSAFRT